jgi:hypothetical protein
MFTRGKSGMVVLFVLLFCIPYSCEVTMEEDQYDLADIPNVTWEYPVKQILETNCVPCHNANLRYKGVRHDLYESELIVVNDGRLRKAINHLPGITRMPYQQKQLPPNELEILNHWIDIGAPEN